MKDTLILCYHAVSNSWGSDLAVGTAQLESQLALLLGRGYRGATFHEAIHAPPAPRTLAVTFDDAYRSVIELGLPVLSRLGLPGTVFVPTAFPDHERPMSWPGIDEWLGGPDEAELMPASWAQLGELAEAGWEIGSHTRTHPRLTRLSDSALREELDGSRQDCEAALGVACRSLAYPFGDEDERVIRATGEAGYTAAGAVPSPLLHPASALRWPRTAVHGTEDERVFRRKASPLRRRLRATRGWRIVAARHRLRERLTSVRTRAAAR